MHIIKRRTATKYIRFSESGDFRTQGDVNKLASIGKYFLESRPDIRIYGHTARTDLSFKGLPENVTVNGSGFMVHNSFTAVKDYINKDRINGRIPFKCLGDCRICNACKYRKHSIILNQYH